jgi:chloride channel 3/4/5
MVLYCILTVMTFGMKLPSGLFIPSMVIGAIFGRLIGLGLQMIVYNNQEWSIWSDYCGKGQAKGSIFNTVDLRRL